MNAAHGDFFFAEGNACQDFRNTKVIGESTGHWVGIAGKHDCFHTHFFQVGHGVGGVVFDTVVQGDDAAGFVLPTHNQGRTTTGGGCGEFAFQGG